MNNETRRISGDEMPFGKASDGPLSPVSAAERIEAMDVLRGFALLGILLMNIEAFVGPLNSAMTGLDPTLTGWNRWADAVIYLLVQGKFWTLFSLLFGMGFAVMMVRAEVKGRPFAALYLRRTLVLLGIGLLHAWLIWSGDILVTYAIAAFVLLLLFRNTPVTRLPKWGAFLYLFPVTMIFLLTLLGELAKADPRQAAEWAKAMAEQVSQNQMMTDAQRLAYGSGDFAMAVGQRLADFSMIMSLLPLMLPMALGMFLLGAGFVRSGVIAEPAQHMRLFGRLRGFGLLLGLVMVGLSFWIQPTLIPGAFGAREGVAMVLGWTGSALICLGYVGWIVTGLQSTTWASRLAVLAPAGRMALSNYLMQSILCTLIFYHYGLGYFEQLPRFWQVPFVLAVYAGQVALSHWWLARFRFGPAEWLWRSLTYLQWQPMRRTV